MGDCDYFAVIVIVGRILQAYISYNSVTTFWLSLWSNNRF